MDVDGVNVFRYDFLIGGIFDRLEYSSGQPGWMVSLFLFELYLGSHPALARDAGLLRTISRDRPVIGRGNSAPDLFHQLVVRAAGGTHFLDAHHGGLFARGVRFGVGDDALLPTAQPQPAPQHLCEVENVGRTDRHRGLP